MHHSLRKVRSTVKEWRALCTCNEWSMLIPTITTSPLEFNLDLIYESGVQVGVWWARHVADSIASDLHEP